jgi:hypothetical protein
VEVVLCTMDSDSTFPSGLRSIDRNDISLFEFGELLLERKTEKCDC